MRAALYARVSTSDQNNALQIGELETYAKSRTWTVQQIEQDQMSGAKATRPGLTAILEAARARRIDVVLVWKLDRFGRSITDLLVNIQILESAGVRFIATTQGIDTDHSNPVSRFTLQILAAVAELEREMIRERVNAGIAAAKAKGVKFGPPLKIFHRGRAMEMRETGATFREIAAEFGIGVGTAHRLMSGVPQPTSESVKKSPPKSETNGRQQEAF